MVDHSDGVAYAIAVKARHVWVMFPGEQKLNIRVVTSTGIWRSISEKV